MCGFVRITFVVTDPPERRENMPVELVFEVASIDRLHTIVTGAGG
jgi:hypothetical protein